MRKLFKFSLHKRNTIWFFQVFTISKKNSCHGNYMGNYGSTLGCKMFAQSKKQLKTRVIIKMSTKPCQPRNFDLFTWEWSKKISKLLTKKKAYFPKRSILENFLQKFHGFHSFLMSACLSGEECPHVLMVQRAQYMRIKNPLHKHFAGMASG